MGTYTLSEALADGRPAVCRSISTITVRCVLFADRYVAVFAGHRDWRDLLTVATARQSLLVRSTEKTGIDCLEDESVPRAVLRRFAFAPQLHTARAKFGREFVNSDAGVYRGRFEAGSVFVLVDRFG